MNGQLVFAKSYEEAKENAVELIGKNSTFEELEKEGYVLESNGDNYIKDALNKCIEYLIKEKEPLIYVSRNAKHQKCKMKIILHSGSVGEIIEYLRGGIDDEKMKTENIPVDYTSYLPTIIEKKLYLSKNKTMVAELTEGREARTTAEASKLKAIVDYFNNHKYVVLMKDFDKEEKGTIPPNIYVVCYGDELHNKNNEKEMDTIDPQPAKPTNILLYGAPGTGKSYTAKQIVEGDAKNTYEHLNLRDLPKGDFVRVTFHPDTDYASFVGCYKPSMNGKEIEYKFVPQFM